VRPALTIIIVVSFGIAGCETPEDATCATCTDSGGFVFDPGTVPDTRSGSDTAVPGADVPDLPTDLGTTTDTETTPDVAIADTTEPDTSDLDVAVPDAAQPDTVVPDLPDTTTLDAFEPDTSPIDTSEPDSSEPDMDEPDVDEPDADEPDVALVDTFIPACGNGKVDPGEACDKAIASGDGACPTECPDPSDPCKQGVVAGAVDNCAAYCDVEPVTAAIAGDGCCPPQVTDKEDADCKATCGDSKVGPGEECDGTNVNGKTCASYGYTSGSLVCLGDCTLSTLTCPNSHLILYEYVPNILIVDDLRRVRWHPSGDMALILGVGGKVVRYDPVTKGISLALTLPGQATDLAAHPDGTHFLVVGNSTDGKTPKVWRLDVDLETLDVTSTELPLALTGTPAVVIHTRDETEMAFVVGTWTSGGGGYQNRVYLIDQDAIVNSRAYAGSAGLQGVMWVPATSGLYATSPAVVTSEGINGKGFQTWILETNVQIPGTGTNSFGNAGRGAFRPGGSYGIVAGTSSNIVYVFTGGDWQKTYLGTNNGGSPTAVSWRPDGSRALVVAGSTGNPVEAKVWDHRPSGPGGYNAATWTDVSIAGFGNPPYNGDFDSDLLDVDWRPGSLCDEGLMVGSDNGSSFSPTLGLLVRFWDQDDPDCN
jgi:hypothetical protein